MFATEQDCHFQNQAVQDAVQDVESTTLLLLIRAMSSEYNQSIMHLAGHLLEHQIDLIDSTDGRLLMDALLAASGPSEMDLLHALLRAPHLSLYHDAIAETLELMYYDSLLA